MLRGVNEALDGALALLKAAPSHLTEHERQELIRRTRALLDALDAGRVPMGPPYNHLQARPREVH